MTPSPAPRTRGLLTLIVPVLLTACSGPQLHGTTVDPWGVPVVGATVVMEGVADRQVTDDKGAFSFPLKEGTLNLLAGKDGYIKGAATVEVPGGDVDEDDFPATVIMLYPDPAEPGFYAVGAKEYEHLEEQPVRTVGTEIAALTGLTTISHDNIPGEAPARFIFSSNLRPDELSRLDLQLHSLNFVPESEMIGVLGPTPVKVNLWVADKKVPFDVKGLHTRNDYLITTREPLKSGAYAFHIQSVLTNTEVGNLDKLPKEMRVAYSFEIP